MAQLMKVDVMNPTPAPRVIHGGATGAEAFRIEPNETKEVVLSAPLIETLRKQAERAGEGNEVRMVVKGPYGESVEAEAPQPQPTHDPAADDPPKGHAPRTRHQ